MAGTISFSGLSASGLDTSSWVDALVSVKQQTVTSLEAQKTEKENLLSIVNNIKSYFSSFQSCLQKLTDSQYGIASMDLFMQNLALSSNANIATATATTEAARQSYDVAVDSLATATKATSGYSQFEVKTADLNTTFGTLGGKNGTITVNSQSFNVTTDDTLGSLVDKFKNVGVDASFDEKKGTFTVGIDLDKIDEGATNLKNALKLKNNNVSGAVSGSIVYANRSTEFSKLGLTAGKITIEGIEHTIAKNGDNYTIQKAGGSAVSMNTLGEFFDYLKSSAVGAEDASVDGKGNITIKGATLDKVEGGSNLMEVLNLIESQKRTVSESGALSYVEVRNADLNTKLSALGVTGDTTLVAGGTNNTISNDKTLGDIQKILKNAGVEMNVDNRGVITIDTKGNEISGTLLDVLNLDPTKGGTTISSSAHQANLKADLNTKLSELGVKDSDKYIAYKSDGTAVTVEMTNLSDKNINTLITDLKNVGLDANFDEKTHQIVIKDGYITGTLADVLGMTQSTTSYTENATLNTTLSALGATGDSTLTIDGGSAKTYGKDTTLETVFGDIKDAGGKVTFKDGNVTIEGVTLGGSIPALLGLDATTQGTSVTSGKLTAVTGSSSTGGGNNATVEHDIDLNTKIGDITGTTSNYTLKVGDGTSTTYTKDSTLQDIKTQIEGAGGKFTINDDNTISIEGVTMSGTLVGVLGFDELETGTRFTTVDSVMISGTSNVATGDTTLGNLGLISGSTSGARGVRRAPANPNKTLSINGGTAKTYGADVTLNDIFADIVAAGGTASIDDEGYINIKGVHLEGTLVDALGLVETSYKTTITSGDLKVTTSTKSTSSSVLYSDQKSDISLNSTVGSIVGDTNSYNLVVNGTNNTIGTNTKLSDIRTIIQNAGGTMTVNDDNTISVNGVEISGSLVDKLGFMSNGVHTVVSSNNPIYYTDGKKSADSGSTFEQLGISADKRDFAIYKNDGTLVKASSTTGSASGKTIGDWLKTINDALNSANGTSGSVYATINNGVISISGGYVTGSLPTELGIGTTQTLTGITMEGNSVTYTEYDPLKYIGNIQTGSGTAAGNVTSTGMIGAVVEYTDEAGNVLQANENTKLADILDTSGNKLGSGSFTFNVGSYTKTFDADSTTLGDVRDYVNNLNTDTTYDTNTSASIADGKIAIESNVDITGTLMSALGFAKSDVSSIAYEIKGTNKVHYSSVDSTTYTTSGFTKSVTEFDASTAVADRVYASSVSRFEAGKTYHISTIADLQKLASLSTHASNTENVNFVLDNDIDMSSVSNFAGINQFEGIFYGNGHVIKNVTINISKAGEDVGFFHDIAFQGEVQDLGLENVTVSGTNNYGLTLKYMSIGALAGECYGKITNCYASGGTVSGNGQCVGGLVGSGRYLKSISDSWTDVTVNKTRAKDVLGAVGGLIGDSCGTISNSYSLGEVNSAYGYVGGFIGIATGTISNSFSASNVKVTNSSSSNTTKTGGFAGAFGMTLTMKNDYQLDDDVTVTMSNNYSTGTVTAAKGSVGGFVGTIITSSSGTSASDYTMSNNFSDSGSASKAIGSGSVSGISAVANSEINSGISGLGFSNLTMTEVVSEHTATTSTTIKDLIGKSGSQTLTLTPTAGGEAVTLTFNDTDTIQTVIDKLKAQGIDEADLTDGIFRVKDDKQWTISGALANKLFGGTDDVYTFTGSKVTYTTTGAGTAGSVTGNKVTYETTGSGTVGSVTGDKLTYTVSTTDGSIVSNEMLYKKLANNSMSISGNKVTYTGTGSGSSGFVLSPDMTDDPSRWQVVLGNGINGNSTLSEILEKNDYIFEDFEAGELLSKDDNAIDGLTANMTLNQLCEKLGWEYSNHTLTAISNTKTDYSGLIIDALFQGAISINPEDTATKTYLSSVSGNLSTGKSYWIKSVEDLQKLATYSQNNDTSRMYFVLDNDIDMSGVNFDGISNFQGEFYGQGHTISNLTTSLFTSVSGANALVKDIGLFNSVVSASGDATGLLAGSVSGGATIMNCYVTGELSASNQTVVGGLVGTITDNALITCSSANVTISGNRGDDAVIGGLVGEASGNAQIRYSHSSGSIWGSTGTVGGFVGQLKGSVAISNGYTTVDVDIVDCNFYGAFAGSICEQVGSGGVEAIGFSGTLSNVFATADVPFASTMDFEDGAIIENVIYNSEANTTTYQPALFANNATGLTLAQMQDGSTMQNYGFNLENLWNTSNGIPDFTDPTASNSKIVATGSTTMAQLGITDFTINGEALSGINANSTVVDVFTALKNEYGIEASISNGTVTFSATSDNYLEGEIINKFFGSKAVEFSTGLNGNSIKSNKVQYSTTETTYRDVYNQFDILPESTNSTKIFDLYVQSMASPSGKKISSGSITVGSVTFTIDASTTVFDLKQFLAREDCYLDSVDGGGGSLYRIVSNNGSSVSVSGDIANDGSSSIGYLCTKSTASAGETVNHNIDNNTTIGQIFGDTTSHTIKVGDETVTLQSTDKLSTLVSKLADKGVTAEIKNSALYLTTSNSTVFSGDIISRFFGQDKVIAGGSTYKYVDIELSTKFSDMEYASTPVFEVDGTQIDGLTKDSTIQDLFNKLASKGINASLSNGKITLTSDTEHTLTGTAVEDFFGGAVTVGSSSSTTTHTATGTTKMSELGITDFTVNGSALSGITSSSTVNDVLSKLKSTYGLSEATISDGKITFKSTTDTTLSGNLIKGLMGQDSVSITPTAGGSSTHTATGTTKMSELGITDFKVNGSALSGITSSSTVDDVLSKLKSTYGLSEATISDGKITFKSTTDTTLSGNLIKGLMGQDSVSITPTAGGSSINTATGTTKMSELGITDFTVNGSALSGITSSSTVNDVLSKLKSTYGLSEATISDGKITLSSTTDTTLSGNLIKGLTGQDSVTITPTAGDTTTHTATENTTLGELGLTSFDLKINGTSISGLSADSKISDVFAKLADSNITATMTDGKITLNSNEATTLSGTVAEKLLGSSSVTLAGDSTEHTFDMEQISAPKALYTSRALTYNSGAQKVSEVTELVAGNKYHIASEADLVKLAEFVNSGADTTGSIFIFDNDIDMSSVANFTSIGNDASHAFKGTIYGNGHVVKNLKIDSTSDYQGLFGYVQQATIQDLGVEDANIKGGAYSGILFGRAENAKLTNLYATGTVSGSSFVGGLVGSLKDSVLEKSYSTATVNASMAVAGGLVGSVVNSTLETVYATGDVNCTASGVVGAFAGTGGLVGTMQSGGTIKNAFATGSVTTKSGGFNGGLIGWLTDSSSYTIDTVYATGNVTGSGGTNGGLIGTINASSVTITNAIYNKNSVSNGVGNGSPDGITGKNFEQMLMKSVMQNAGFTEDKGWVYKDGATPTFGNMTVSGGGGKVYLDDTITSFTSGSAYYISSLEQLNKLASLVNSGASTAGVSFILENDIDVSAFTTAIGSDTNAFKGTFYGNGHVLTGLKTNLFDNIDGEAVIRDIGLENMNGGYLAAYVMGSSTIDNVYSTGSAKVAGLVNKLGGSATIKNSYSTATVNSSSASAGGLVAQMEGSATIEKSFATGNVKASTSAGALVGSMSGGTVKSSYATGNVTGGSNRGGLIGQVTGSVTIQNSYASGTATGGFIGINSGSVTSTGNVYNSANSKAVGSGSSISGLTAISLADMKSHSKMEALGFTASNGWHYYAGKTPMLQGQDISSGHSANVSLSTKIDSILNSGDGRNVKVTANGTTYEKWFEPTDTVKDVRDWLNTIDGVTATFDETNSTFKVSGTSEDFKIDGDLASALFGGRKTTTKTSATVNTDSNELLVDGSQTKITNNTTVGQLLGKASGNYAIGFYDDNGNLVTKNFGVDTKLSEVLQYLKDNGFEASITNGVFTATKDGNTTTDILGTIGNKLKGETGTVTTTDTGYRTGVLGLSSSVKATASTKLSELGIDSGSILIKDNNNNNLGTIQINNSMTIDDTAQLLANYGFTLTITDGKVTVAGEGINRLADGTSNLVSKMKLDNWTETKDKLKTTSTVAQMGFAKGATLGLVLDSKTYNLTFDANATLQDIIDTLGTYGVTASVDSDGKFTATASGNLVLTNELGAYLTKNSAEGYVKEADGYKSKDPLEFKGDKVKLDYDSKVGDILGTGKDGVLRLTIDNTTVVDLRYRADETMSDIIADLKGYGITATINDGVLTAVSDGHTFRFSGEIGKIISGDTPLYEDISTGYKSKDLSYETTGKATLDNTLKEMGISSGQIHVLSNDGKIVSTLDIDNSYTVAQVKSLLQPFGMDLAIDADGKVTVTSSEGYKLSDGTSNMVSTMKLNSWTTTTEKLTGATTLSQMGFKDGADLNLFLDGAVMNVLSFNADQTLDDISFALSAYGIDASVNADGQFTATSKTHTFIMSGGLGSYLTKGTGGYVNSDTDYKSYKPLTEEHPYITDTSKELGYKKLMTESSTLDSLGFAQGGSVRIMLDGTTPYSLEFLATDTVQDVIYALSAYGINAEVKDGKFVAESVNNTFTITGNFGSYLVQGGAYNNEVTGYESAPLTYNTTEKLTNDTKLASLGVTRGAINVIKDGKVADTINITNDTTIGQLFSAIKPYGMSGSIVTDASGNTSIRISADSDIKLADGTSNVVSALGLHDIRQGDFEGHKEYWDDDATSGLITEGMLLSSLDRNGFIAQGSLIFTTGEGDDAVQHIINITADETVGSLLKKFNDSGIKAELDNGIIKLTGGLDKLTFNGGTSGLVNTIGLDIHNIDKYASSSSALTYEGETHYSASNFANANTTLDIVNTTDGIMSVFVDGIKCNVEVKSSDTFAKLFKKIKDTVKAKSGLDIEAGFMTKDGTISTNPTDANNTGIIALSVAEGHELVIGASNDTTNFATIANLNKTGYNTITGSRALYRVNVNSLITQSGLYRDGDITEGTFIIGDAEFTIDSTTTLSSLIDQINKNDKAYANAYWDTLSGTLVIQSTNTGASLINIEAGTSNFTDIMGFTKTKDGVSALVTDSQTLGQNAVVRINGTTVTSATNVITSDISRIKGLTINLKNVSEGETVTITVEQDKESIYNAVSDTLDSYNAMMEALNKELSDRSSLGGESILKLMRNNLKRLMTSSLTGAYVFKNLASVGISTGQASDDISTNVTSLLIDKDKFMDALNTDSDAVQDLLVGTKANPGIFLQANNIVESSIKTDGYFSNMANTLTKSINNIDKKITKTNNDIENYRTKLQSKFHNMELTISGLQSAYANLLGQG